MVECADQGYERCMRMDMSMRGFGGGKRTSKLKTGPSIKEFDTFIESSEKRPIPGPNVYL